jgi:hypothetical protein
MHGSSRPGGRQFLNRVGDGEVEPEIRQPPEKNRKRQKKEENRSGDDDIPRPRQFLAEGPFAKLSLWSGFGVNHHVTYDAVLALEMPTNRPRNLHRGKLALLQFAGRSGQWFWKAGKSFPPGNRSW